MVDESSSHGVEILVVDFLVADVHELHELTPR